MSFTLHKVTAAPPWLPAGAVGTGTLSHQDRKVLDTEPKLKGFGLPNKVLEPNQKVLEPGKGYCPSAPQSGWHTAD